MIAALQTTLDFSRVRFDEIAACGIFLAAIGVWLKWLLRPPRVARAGGCAGFRGG